MSCAPQFLHSTAGHERAQAEGAIGIELEPLAPYVQAASQELQRQNRASMGHFELAAGYPSLPPTESFSFFPEPSENMQGSPDHDDTIALLEDVEIDIAIPSKLMALDFPKAEDDRDEDVAKVIRKSFSKLGPPQRGQDALSSLAKTGVSCHLSWQAQVESAVEHQGDDFWQRVSRPLVFL